MRLSISFALLLLWQLTLQFLILCSVECTPFGGNFIPLPTLTGQLPDISEIQQTAMNAIDDMTVQSLNLIMGSKSYQIPLPSNQSVHAIEFKGYGNLPPIVLLHGITSCASDYYPLIRQLQTKCSRVVAIDLPGHGKTVSDPNQGLKKLEGLMIESVRSAICTLDTRNCILVGNSLGGFVASRYASLYSGELCSLVLISPAGAPLSYEELAQVKQMFAMETLWDSFNLLSTVFGKSRYQLRVLPLLPFLTWACRERGRRPSVRKMLEAATPIRSRLRPDELGAIKCPVLLIWGEEERVFGEQHLRWFSDHLPTKNREIIRPKGVGHIPHLDADIITDLIAEFNYRMLPPWSSLAEMHASSGQGEDAQQSQSDLYFS